MATNTNYDPVNINAFEKTKLNKDAHGTSGTVPHGTDYNIDLTLSDDVVMAGGHMLLVKNAVWGDTADFQVVHPNGQTVLKQFVTGWPINPDSTDQKVPTANYPAKIFAGLILRIVYHSVGTETDVKVAMGYNLEKVLE